MPLKSRHKGTGPNVATKVESRHKGTGPNVATKVVIPAPLDARKCARGLKKAIIKIEEHVAMTAGCLVHRLPKASVRELGAKF